ncbi:MAG TPA: PH domain-containing protein [Pleomorphomonadaceae bacterium]|nr:PH domain-containing protein [Pleomorphomonadaceae bacterium]
MSYARKLLARGEEVTFESGQHWFAVVGRSWWAIILAILALAVLLFLVNPPDASLDGPGELVALVLLLVALGRIAWVIWGWRNTEFLVTTRRIIRAEGILNKRMSDSSLEKVNDAHLTQNLFGRIFGFGDLDILTAADELGGIEDFPLLADPVDFKIAMLNQKELLERPDLAAPAYQRQQAPSMRPAEPMSPRAGSDRVTRIDERAGAPSTSTSAPAAASEPTPATPAAPSPAPGTPAEDATATLERLASLRDRGLITAEEYDAKKRELLERI